MSEIRTQLTDAFRGLVDSIVAQTPRVIVGIVLIIVAVLVAKFIERLVRGFLTRVKFDEGLKRVGVDSALRRVGLQRSVSRVLSRAVYFLLLLLFFKTASDGLGLSAISDAIGGFLAYLPNLVAAALIMIIGSVAAQTAGKAVSGAAENSGIEFSSTLGTVVTAVLMFVLGMMAIGQLRVDTDIIRVVTMGALGGLALAFGLSFGLGSRDVTRNILAGFYARKTFEMGEPLRIGDTVGRLTAITPTQTILTDGDEMVAVANSAFLEEVVRQ
ncbi:MAG: mechanosensitive ion channel [Gemmatimonadota bacterium]|nr:mechanosensitive ion channel [Gemmatimonadota bacterium]